jgi:hypothetical protein
MLSLLERDAGGGLMLRRFHPVVLRAVNPYSVPGPFSGTQRGWGARLPVLRQI